MSRSFSLETRRHDGVDNDVDGIDMSDPCPPWDRWSHYQCYDGIDNDGDGLIDYNETDAAPHSTTLS
jgi:hypothetical protein